MALPMLLRRAGHLARADGRLLGDGGGRGSYGEWVHTPGSTVFEIKAAPGTDGVGVFATHSIPQGARILVERPLLSLPEEVSYEDLGPLQHQADSIINTAVAALSRAQRAQLFQLQDCRATAGGTASTASGILYTNAFSAEPGTTGYFLTAARFNHSCTPNVGYSWNASLTAMTMHAHVDVAAGEELLISYKARYAPRSSRREALHAQYRFTCHCKACALTGKAQKASSSRRVEIQRVREAICASASRRLDSSVLAQVEHQVRLMREEGLHFPADLQYLYNLAYEVCKHLGQHSEARSWLRLASACNALAEGTDTEGFEHYARLLSLPVDTLDT
ncbi:MAG: hypothetical protein WDW36_003371 [Sanguina aurantia]